MTIPGFISWAHKDHKLLEQVWPHVRTLCAGGRLADAPIPPDQLI
jgi:hypothetical protein